MMNSPGSRIFSRPVGVGSVQYIDVRGVDLFLIDIVLYSDSHNVREAVFDARAVCKQLFGRIDVKYRRAGLHDAV